MGSNRGHKMHVANESVTPKTDTPSTSVSKPAKAKRSHHKQGSEAERMDVYRKRIKRGIKSARKSGDESTAVALEQELKDTYSTSKRFKPAQYSDRQRAAVKRALKVQSAAKGRPRRNKVFLRQMSQMSKGRKSGALPAGFNRSTSQTELMREAKRISASYLNSAFFGEISSIVDYAQLEAYGGDIKRGPHREGEEGKLLVFETLEANSGSLGRKFAQSIFKDADLSDYRSVWNTFWQSNQGKEALALVNEFMATVEAKIRSGEITSVEQLTQFMCHSDEFWEFYTEFIAVARGY